MDNLLQPFQFKIEDVPGVPTPDGTTIKLPVHPQVTGMPKTAPISILWVIIPPGEATARHKHDISDEYEYIVTGTGVLDVAQETDIVVEPEMMVFNPMGVMHQVRNTGKDTIILLRVHVPPLEPKPSGHLAEAIKLANAWFTENISDKK